jgi:hypothetical protein
MKVLVCKIVKRTSIYIQMLIIPNGILSRVFVFLRGFLSAYFAYFRK